MLIFRRVTHNMFLISEPTGSYILTFHDLAGDLVRISLAPIVDVDEVSGIYCLGEEVWSSTIWSLQPRENLLSEVGTTMYRVAHLEYPIELVYAHGGQLCGRDILVNPLGVFH